MKEQLRHAVRYFYDLQKLRIQAGNRDSKQDKPAELDERDKQFLGKQSDAIKQLEKETLSEVRRHLKSEKIWTKYLKEQKGCGPTMAGVILAEVDITRCETVSQLWAFCGLAVIDGKSQRRVKGQKANYNPWLKSKVLSVLGGCLLKANSPWRKHYDDYKHRKQHSQVKCMACEGKSKKSGGKKTDCANCGNTGIGPWGFSDGHRHNAAMRYMVKMFLAELWRNWRELEGLPVTEPYAEAKLGRKHGGHLKVVA